MGGDIPSLDLLFTGLITIFNKYLVPVIGMVSVAVFIAAGFMRMMSGGNPQNVAKANAALMWAVVGIIVALGGVFLTKVFVNGVLGVNIPS